MSSFYILLMSHVLTYIYVHADLYQVPVQVAKY